MFDSVLSTNRDRPSKDICNSFFQSCKFLDMVLLLSPSTILTYAWNFISSVQDSRIVESYFLKVANKFPNNEIVVFSHIKSLLITLCRHLIFLW